MSVAIPPGKVIFLGNGNGTTSSAVIGDNQLVRGDGGARGVQGSSVTLSDTDGTFTQGTTNGSIIFVPNGIGIVSSPANIRGKQLQALGATQSSLLLNRSDASTSSGFVFGRSSGSDDGQDFFIYDIAAAAFRYNISSTGVHQLKTGSGTVALTLDVTQNATGVGYLNGSKVLVSAKTQAASPYAVSATTDNRVCFTNEGATAMVTFTLPTAAANLDYTFYVQDADGVTVTANTGDTIRLAGSVTASAGSVSSTTIGSCIRLRAINATEWVAVSIVGTWA
jgi:hypothetical protein